MPGDPAETMIGVAGAGIGILLLYSAYRNINPADVIRQAVTTGSFDLSKASPLVTGGSGQFLGKLIMPASVTKAVSDIKAKDPSLASSIQSELNSIDTSKDYTTSTKHLFDLMSQARSEGFTSQADAIESWVNKLNWPKATGTSAPTPSGGVIQV